MWRELLLRKMTGGQNNSVVQVQGTNDSSIVSKCSMVQMGYFNDPVIHFFVKKVARRAPLIHLGYYVRAVVIDYVLQTFIQQLQNQAGQIISLGAGFDSSYFRMKATGALDSNVTFYEVDFHEVVARKITCIMNSHTLQELVGHKLIHHGDSSMIASHYRLVSADLRIQSQLESALLATEINYTLPTLCLSECAITYMDEKSSSVLIEWVATNFPNSTFATYEQVYPNDGFGKVMQGHFDKLQSPLLSLNMYPGIQDQKERYRKYGWDMCFADSVFNVLMKVTSEEEKQRVLKLEPFDEFEEWHLKCCHYVLVLACRGKLQNWVKLKEDKSTRTSRAEVSFNWNLVSAPKCLQRFGHRIVCVGSSIFVIGGFGPSERGNRRCRELAIINAKSLDLSTPVCNTKDYKTILDLMYCEVCCLSGNRILIVGGRTSPVKPNQDLFIIHGNEICPDSVAKIETQETSGNEPCPRWRHSIASMTPSEEELVFIYGGRGPELQVFGDLFELNTKSWNWEKVQCEQAPPARFSHSASVWHTCMIISGGLGENFLPLNDVWMFDNANKSWKELPVVGMLPRYSHSSIIWNDKLIMIGGVNTLAGQQPGCAVIDLKTNVCSEYQLPNQTPEYPIMLHNHSTAMLPEGNSVLVVGGGGTCFSFGTSFNSCIIKIDLNQFNDVRKD